MKHSGLQKSISSIFDGSEPARQDTAAAVGTQTIEQPVATPMAKPQPVTPTVPSAAASTPAPTATPTAPVSTAPYAPAPVHQAPTAVMQPVKPASRPRPVPRTNKAGKQKLSTSDAWKTLKAKLTGSSKGSMDSRQMKTLILGICLALVFVVVLLFVLGSSPVGVKAASKIGDTDSAAASGKNAGGSENWQKPEIYPLSLRDPMNPSSGSKNTAGDVGEMTVRGIVYSSVNPSAIIANQIVYEGDVILGVKIIKIAKDFVVFEKEGKQWQQQVRQ